MTAPAQNSFVTAQHDSAELTGSHGFEDSHGTHSTTNKLLRSEQLFQWDSGAVDVQLSAISCMDVYRMLVVQKKPVELVPQGPTEALGKPLQAETTSLVTRHEAGKLALRCRKISMETDTSSDVRYRLYVVAGFAVSKTTAEQVQRVPIVLVPVKMERLRGRGTPYTITYTGEPLRLNPHIAESCSSHVDQLIRPFETDADLRSYLRTISRKLHARLQCRVSANTGLFTLQEGVLEDLTISDQIDIQLEKTKPGAEFKPLPPVPENFNAQLASRMLRHISESELNTALETFSGVRQVNLNTTLDYELEFDESRKAKITKCAEWMCELGLGHWQLANLKSLPTRIKRMSGSLQALSYAPAFNRYFQDENQSVGMVLNLYKARKRICNSPPEMQHHAISLHADPETRLLLQKAKIQATTIEQEMEVLHETFHMSAVPSSAALHNLIKVIAKREESSQLTNPSYFRARRQLNEILKTHNGLITDNDLQKLEKMASTLRFAELFDTDKYYKRYFGSLFHGIRTNWQRLDSVVSYVRNLSYDLGSAGLAGRLSEQWPTFQRDFDSIQELLQPAATDAHQLRSLIPLLIDDNTTLPAAIRTATKLHGKVNTWQTYLNRYVPDTSLTPYQIANSHGMDFDASQQQVELPQRDYDERIYQHIVGVGLSDDCVAATAEWLSNTINHLEIDIPTVRRYLDGESTLSLSRHVKVV